MIGTSGQTRPRAKEMEKEKDKEETILEGKYLVRGGQDKQRRKRRRISWRRK